MNRIWPRSQGFFSTILDIGYGYDRSIRSDHEMICPESKREEKCPTLLKDLGMIGGEKVSPTNVMSRTLMLVENYYPHDIRIRKEAKTLTTAGYSVTIICLKGKGQKAYEEIEGIRVYRVPEITVFDKHHATATNVIGKAWNVAKPIMGYTIEFLYFTCAALLMSLYVLVRHGFDVVHAHNPPDSLAIIGIFYRSVGKQYVFDHHDLCPELYLTRVSNRRGILYNSLLVLEKASCKFANIIISTNESYKEIEIKRHSVDPAKIYVVRNNPIISDCNNGTRQTRQFQSPNRRSVLIFLGCINPQDGVDILLKVLHHLVYVYGRKDWICNIIGGGDYLVQAKLLAVELKVSEHVMFSGMVTDRETVKRYLEEADIGVEPAPLNDANKHSTFIKVMEYMAASKPVVAFDLVETRVSANGAALLVEPGDYAGFACAIKELLDAPLLREQLGRAGFERIQKELNWKTAASRLIEAYAALSLQSVKV